MSGGSYDYAYRDMDSFIRYLDRRANTPLRKAFVKHLAKVAKAMHDIEWVDSGDYSEGDENKAIQDCLGDNWKSATYQEVLDAVKQLEEQLVEIINA